MNERIVVGMDIGTTKVCAVVASADDLDRINILGVGVLMLLALNFFPQDVVGSLSRAGTLPRFLDWD